MPRLDRGILYGGPKRIARSGAGNDEKMVRTAEKERGLHPIPNIFRQLAIACIQGFSAAGACQMSAGGLVPKIFS